MAVRATPIFIDGNTHPAEETRLATQSMLVGATGSFAGGVAAADSAHGVGTTSDLAVSANATPNMTVNVAAGGAFIRGTQSSNQGAYHLWNDATVSLSIDAADATNPRRDLVIAQVRDSNYSGSDDDARLVVVTGTPAAVPTDPSLSSYPNALVLARVTVAANDTAIGAGDITDLRTLANIHRKVPVVASTTARDLYVPSPVAGQGVYLDTGNATEGIQFYNGTSWRLPWNMPWGYLTKLTGSAPGTVLRSGSSSATVNFVNASYTHVNNRRIRVTASGNASWTTATNSVWVLVVGGTTIARNEHAYSVTFDGATLVADTTTTASSITYTLQQGYGPANSAVTVYEVAPYIIIEDIGPSGAPV